MKKYDKKAIKKFIEDNKDDIHIAYAGLAEVWGETYDIMYSADDNYIYKGLLTDEENLRVWGTDSSVWATPSLVVVWKSGKATRHDLYIEYAED